MPTRLSNETDTVLLVPAYEAGGLVKGVLPGSSGGLVPYDAMTTAILNYYAPVVTTAHANAGSGGNVTCAIVSDKATIHLADSKTDDEKTLCDPGNSVSLSDLTAEVDLTGFRDANPAATDSVFNVWRNLTFGPDVPYLIVHRVGFDSTAPFAVGQEIDVYYMTTDWPVDVHEDGNKQKIQEKFINRSVAKISYVLAA